MGGLCFREKSIKNHMIKSNEYKFVNKYDLPDHTLPIIITRKLMKKKSTLKKNSVQFLNANLCQ